VVCEVLKGSWAIWIGGKKSIYNTMRPIITLNDLEKEDEIHGEEESQEPEQDRTGRNLRILLREEMEASFIGFAEDKDNLRQAIVNSTRFKDSTEALVLPNFDRKDDLPDEEYQYFEQIGEMIEVADDEDRNSRQLEMDAEFSGSRNPEGEDFIAVERNPQ
jgi:hypothetical protein